MSYWRDIMALFTTGGYTVDVRCDEQHFEKFGIPGWIPAAFIARPSQDGSQPIVSVTPGFFDLSAKAQIGILTHEVGHYASGHLDWEEAKSNELINNPAMEAQADAWACSIIGDDAFDAFVTENVQFIKQRVEVKYHSDIDYSVAVRKQHRLDWIKNNA